MEPEKDSPIEITRRLGDFEVSAPIESRSILIDEHNAAFRWMAASLFAETDQQS